jgi:hypothetical protein
VSQIISQVVLALSANPARKFSVTEQAYFQIWYETQSPATQAQVQSLVASGQLTFINGAFSMHDEANPTYVDMLDNTHVGQRNIASNFGVHSLPNITWQIDPFGHSAFQGVGASSRLTSLLRLFFCSLLLPFHPSTRPRSLSGYVLWALRLLWHHVGARAHRLQVLLLCGAEAGARVGALALCA